MGVHPEVKVPGPVNGRQPSGAEEATLPKEVDLIMSQFLELLKRLDSRVANIELSLNKPKLSDVLKKTHYSCAEVAELTQRFGTKRAKEFTVRLACSAGRIPEAQKFPDGRWRIPQAAVERILSVGLPPERRKHS